MKNEQMSPSDLFTDLVNHIGKTGARMFLEDDKLIIVPKNALCMLDDTHRTPVNNFNDLAHIKADNQAKMIEAVFAL